MSEPFEFILRGLIIGVGATLAMDLWALFLRRAFKIASLDFKLLGRWFLYLPKGKWIHAPIMSSPTLPGERPTGWALHYFIGITFSYVLLLGWGLSWAYNPSLGPALLVGLGTTVAPFFILQPGFGLGIAAAKTAQPQVARIKSLLAHAIYGIGLYATALLISKF